MVVLLNLSKDL